MLTTFNRRVQSANHRINRRSDACLLESRVNYTDAIDWCSKPSHRFNRRYGKTRGPHVIYLLPRILCPHFFMPPPVFLPSPHRRSPTQLPPSPFHATSTHSLHAPPRLASPRVLHAAAHPCSRRPLEPPTYAARARHRRHGPPCISAPPPRAQSCSCTTRRPRSKHPTPQPQPQHLLAKCSPSVRRFD